MSSFVNENDFLDAGEQTSDYIDHDAFSSFWKCGKADCSECINDTHPDSLQSLSLVDPINKESCIVRFKRSIQPETLSIKSDQTLQKLTKANRSLTFIERMDASLYRLWIGDSKAQLNFTDHE